MEEAFAENSFAIPDRVAGDTRVHGLFLLHSRFNHSCLPNTNVPDTADEFITSFATRDIAAGEEIFFCYEAALTLRTRADRHRLLRFSCDCRACVLGTPFQLLSDMRRTLARGLQYLTCGIDLDGQQDRSAKPIINRPTLKKAAETLNIPLSSRLIYNLLLMIMLQDEGLLDDFMVKRMSPRIIELPEMFQTESNATIAKHAMTQDTWMRRFCVSLRLWGKQDAADDASARLYRSLRGDP